jgi:hypothetical protein
MNQTAMNVQWNWSRGPLLSTVSTLLYPTVPYPTYQSWGEEHRGVGEQGKAFSDTFAQILYLILVVQGSFHFIAMSN